MLINEWQLGNELNRSVQQQQHADFRLWLAFLSPAIEEQAGFCLADQQATPQSMDLRQQLQLVPQRDYGLQSDDLSLLQQHTQLMAQGGFAAMRLGLLLQPPPAVVRHDAKKLSADLSDNLSLHCKRHLANQAAPMQTTDATLLFDVLEQLHTSAAA
jgi:hypothetical protein